MNSKKLLTALIAGLSLCSGGLAIAGTDGSGLLVVTHVETNSPALRKIVYYNSDSRKEVATVGYNFVYGGDEANLAFLEPLHSDLYRLLVIDRTNFNVVADKKIGGMKLVSLRPPIASTLAADSKRSLVYCSMSVKNGLGIVAIDWETGSVRELDLGTSEQARGLSPYLSPTPNGFVTQYNRIAKHSVIVLYNTTSEQPELKMANIKGGANVLISVPDFGLVEYESGWTNMYQLTDESFSIALLSPPEISNIKFDGSMAVRKVDGRPCLIWGENYTNSASHQRLISNIVFYDLISKVVLSRIPITEPVGPVFSPDRNGDKIYFANQATGNIFSLDRKTGRVSLFAKTELHDFGGWGGSNFLDAN